MVRLGIAQADGKTCLGVTIHHQHFLPRLCQTSSQIDADGRFGYTSLLVHKGDYLCVYFDLSPHKLKF